MINFVSLKEPLPLWSINGVDQAHFAAVRAHAREGTSGDRAPLSYLLTAFSAQYARARARGEHGDRDFCLLAGESTYTHVAQ
jgi:hypothetical protein